jgi:nitrite reductase (NO-forming)
VLLGSSSSAIVEFVIPEAGNYVMVDHHFANASQGAIGVISAGAAPGSDPEHHNIPATAAPTDPAAQTGKLAFESKCLACHTIAGGDKVGPDLYGVTKRRDAGWLARWLKSPEQMLQSDATAKGLLDKYKLPMPNQGLSDAEIKQYIAYFKWADQNLQPRAAAPAAGASQPASAPAASRPALATPQPAAPGSTLPPSKTESATPMPAPAVSPPSPTISSRGVPGPAQGNPGGMAGMAHP